MGTDHIIPTSKGGPDWGNLVHACASCNSRKKDYWWRGFLHHFRKSRKQYSVEKELRIERALSGHLLPDWLIKKERSYSFFYLVMRLERPGVNSTYRIRKETVSLDTVLRAQIAFDETIYKVNPEIIRDRSGTNLWQALVRYHEFRKNWQVPKEENAEHRSLWLQMVLEYTRFTRKEK